MACVDGAHLGEEVGEVDALAEHVHLLLLVSHEALEDARRGSGLLGNQEQPGSVQRGERPAVTSLIVRTRRPMW